MRRSGSPCVELAVEPLQLVELAGALAVLLAHAVEPLLDDGEVVQHQLGVEVGELPRRVGGRQAVEPAKPRTTRQKASTSASARSDSESSPVPLPAGPGTSTKRISVKVVFLGLKMRRERVDAGVGHLDGAQVDMPRSDAPPRCWPVSALKRVVLPDCA